MNRPGQAIRWPHDYLQLLGSLRDTSLLLTGGAYAAGFVVWSVVAFAGDFPPPPVLDAQYFAAGVVPVLLVVATLYFVVLARKVSRHWAPMFMAKTSANVRRVVALSTIVIALSGLFLILWIAHFLERNPPGVWPATIRVIMLGFVLGLAVVCLFGVEIMGTHPPGGAASQVGRLRDLNTFSMRAFVVVVLPALCVIAMLQVYVYAFFPALPQQFGGARPRLARLDISRSALSTETALILGCPAAAQPITTFQTPPVSILFLGHEAALVVPREIPCFPRVIELPRSDIHSIEWLTDESLPTATARAKAIGKATTRGD